MVGSGSWLGAGRRSVTVGIAAKASSANAWMDSHCSCWRSRREIFAKNGLPAPAVNASYKVSSDAEGELRRAAIRAAVSMNHEPARCLMRSQISSRPSASHGGFARHACHRTGSVAERCDDESCQRFGRVGRDDSYWRTHCAGLSSRRCNSRRMWSAICPPIKPSRCARS